MVSVNTRLEYADYEIDNCKPNRGYLDLSSYYKMLDDTAEGKRHSIYYSNYLWFNLLKYHEIQGKWIFKLLNYQLPNKTNRLLDINSLDKINQKKVLLD